MKYMFDDKIIKEVEKHYKAKHVCDTEYKNNDVAVFYTEKKHDVSQSHYFALYFRDSELMITNGEFVKEQRFNCVESKSGEMIYSTHRHDYRTSEDGSVSIDGGRDYTRTIFSSEYKPRIITMKVVNDKLEICE